MSSSRPPGRRKRASSRRPPRTANAAGARSKAWLLALAFVGCVLLGAPAWLLLVYPRGGAGDGKGSEITLSSDAAEAARALDAAGFIEGSATFALYLKLTRTRVAPGVHLLERGVAPGELARRIERQTAGGRVRVTIPEGFHRFDIAKRLAKQLVCTEGSFVAATAEAALMNELAIPGDSAEGYLFPATYELPKDADAKDIVRRLKTEFDKRYAALEKQHPQGVRELRESFGFSQRDIIILASIIEKEAASDAERPLVASVFLNRLRDPSFRRKVLQSDPTAGYGCLLLRAELPSCAGYAGKITHDINADPKNPYSTYTHERLPPGPIANPGTASLAAVLAPASTRFLYFVAKGDGKTTFSETYEAHQVHTSGMGGVKSPKPGSAASP
jgi:UPF0755 protein